jgi:hypothetical protein
MIGKSLTKISRVTDVMLFGMAQALNHVCVIHGLPSIAWNPICGKSSFAEPIEDILRLKSSRCPDSKRRMVESVGSAPTSTCLQSRCITCLPRPHENGRPPRCRPERTEFWRLGCASWRAACEIWFDPSARHNGGRRRGPKLKGPGARRFVAVRKDLPARAISIKNKHLLVIYSIPARGFTAAVSVFRGTPPPKPLICKFVSNRLGAHLRSRWADPTGEMPRHSCALIRLALSDIIETSLCYCSQTVHLSLPPFSPSVSGK